MIHRHKTDIWATPAEAIVIPVNTKGVMGAGLAFQAKELFPVCLSNYVRLTMTSALNAPGLAAMITPHGFRPVLIAFTSKDHWKQPSQFRWIEMGIWKIMEAVRKAEVTSCAIPALGCGLGGLEVRKVMGAIEEACLQAPEIEWHLYKPNPKLSKS